MTTVLTRPAPAATPARARATGIWPTYFGYGLPFVAVFVTMAVSVIMGVLVRNTGAGSLAVAGVFHWLLNLGILLLLNFENGSLRDMTVLAAVSVVAAVAVVHVAGDHR